MIFTPEIEKHQSISKQFTLRSFDVISEMPCLEEWNQDSRTHNSVILSHSLRSNLKVLVKQESIGNTSFLLISSSQNEEDVLLKLRKYISKKVSEIEKELNIKA